MIRDNKAEKNNVVNEQDHTKQYRMSISQAKVLDFEHWCH